MSNIIALPNEASIRRLARTLNYDMCYCTDINDCNGEYIVSDGSIGVFSSASLNEVYNWLESVERKGN